MRLSSCKKLVRENFHPVTSSGLFCLLSLRWIQRIPQLNEVQRFDQPKLKHISLKMWTSWIGLESLASNLLSQLLELITSSQVVLMLKHVQLLWVMSFRMCYYAQISLLLAYVRFILVLLFRMCCSELVGLWPFAYYWQIRSCQSRQID